MLYRLAPLVLAVAVAGCSGSASPSPTSTPSGPGYVGAVPQTSPVSGTRPGAHSTSTGHKTGSALPTVKPVVPPTPKPIPASAYISRVHGVVTDAKSRSPIAGAVVTVGDGRKTAKTNAFGEYSVKFPADLAVPLTVNKPGYQEQLAMGSLKPYKSVRVNFKLLRIIPGHPSAPAPPSVFTGP